MRGTGRPAMKIPECAPTAYSATADTHTSATASSSVRQNGRSSGSVAYAASAPTNSSRYSPSLKASRATAPRCSACSAESAIAPSVAANAASIARTGSVVNAATSGRENASAVKSPTSPALSVVIVVGPT